MEYFIIYETTNLLNGKKYRGMHKTKNLYDDGYLGSGKILLKSIEKNGKENFFREILEFCNSYKELAEREKFWVDEEWVDRKDTYNLVLGGRYVMHTAESLKRGVETLRKRYESGELIRYVKTISIEHRKKISISLKERYKLHEHPSKGKKSWNTGTKGLTTSWNKGLKLPPMPEEYRDKISKGLKKKYETEEHHSKGKKPWNAGKKGVQIPWNAGIKMPKVKCPHCEKECDKLNASKWHFDKCKFKVQK